MLFPGQGSQKVGMVSQWSSSPVVVKTFKEASDTLGYDLFTLAQEGPESSLNQTEITQPVMLTADVALFRVWLTQAPAFFPYCMAGHSLGEYSALVCAEVLSFPEALELVFYRGRYMQEAVPLGEGGMGVVIGLKEDEVQQICREASEEGFGLVSPANYNTVGQVVISGASSAVDRALQLAKERGSKMSRRIAVSVPSHCEAMKPAAERLAKKLNQLDLKPARVPIFQNVDGYPTQDPEVLRNKLINQLISPVHWVKTIQAMVKEGVSYFVECGPGQVLSGLNKRMDFSIRTFSCDTTIGMQTALDAIQ